MSKIYHSLVNNSLLDITGNYTNTLTLGTSRGFVNCNLGSGALEFDGADTKVDTGFDFIGTGDITISAWIYPRSYGENSLGLFLYNGKFLTGILSTNKWRVSSDNSTAAYSSDNSVIFNRWSHIVVTRTSSGITNIYINGVLSGTADQNSGTPSAGANVIIGNTSGQIRTWDGYIQNFQVYNEIISESKRNELYNEFTQAQLTGGLTRTTSGYTYSQITNPNYDGLIAYWNMQKSGLIIPDVSKNMKPATISGITTTVEGINGVALNMTNNAYASYTSGLTANFTAFSGIYLINIKDFSIDGGGYPRLQSIYVDNNNFIAVRINSNEKANNLNILLKSNSVDYSVQTDTNTLTANNWLVLGFSYNGATVTTYINGSAIANTSTTGVIGGVTQLFAYNTTSGRFNGIAGDFLNFNTALTANQHKYWANKLLNNHIIVNENFWDEGADGITKIPMGWRNGTGTVNIRELTSYVSKNLDKRKKYLQFVTAGTMIYPIDLSQYYNNGYISYDYYNGSSWSTRSGWINAPVTGVTYANNKLTFTGTNIGDRITNIKITIGV